MSSCRGWSRPCCSAGPAGRSFCAHPNSPRAYLRLDEAISLFAALMLGAPLGALTSLVATVGTPEPAFSSLWAIEALLVGLAVNRGAPPVLTVVAYWMLVGALFGSGLLPTPALQIDPRMLLAKQVINGALSGVLAHLAATSPSIRRLFRAASPPKASSLRTQVARALVPVSAVPVILLGLGLGRIYSTHLVNEGTSDLETRATTVAARLADHLAAAERDVATLAGSLSGPAQAPEEVERILLLHHAGTELRTLAATDADGQVLALSVRDTGLVRDRVLPTVADRPYFLEPRRTGRPFRSSGFQGRGFVAATNAGIIAVSAPRWTDSGRFDGVVQGSVGLSELSAWLAQAAGGEGIAALVLDSSGLVIAAAGAGAPALLTDSRDLGWVQATAAAPTTASLHDASEPAEGTRAERFVTVRRDFPGGQGWRVHVRRSIASMQAPLAPFYAVSAGWLLLCIVVAMLMTGRVARHVTHPIEALARAAEGIGRGHQHPRIDLPATAPTEVRLLHRELDAMVTRLDDSLRLLDQKVNERSAALAAATARTDTVFRAASDGMLILDADRRVLDVNDAFCRMVGLTRAQLLGTAIRDLEIGATEESRSHRDVLHSRTGASRFETLVRTSSGDALPVEIVLTNLPGGRGELCAGVRDISERRRAETERAQLEARLRQSQKMEAIGTLAGGIAHDFNNILTLIAGSADLAAEDVPAGHPARPYLDQILRASARAEALVRQILTFSRRRDEQREVVALSPIVREAAGILRSTLPAMIEIRTDIDDAVPAVQADAVQIHQVLMNLGSNAAHAMGDRGGVLSIALGPSATPGADGRADAVLTVTDTGAGMDRATLERIFEPFFTTKPLGIGTGLGLAVVHGIVNSHGGTIDATSVPGQGTTFRITLPPADRLEAAAPEGDAPVAPPPHRSARVLVVDDEPELVGLICKQLTRLGYTAQGCPGPAEALEVLRQGDTVDVVVSDLAMPRMSGIELAEQIRQVRPGMPIVLCSGRVSEFDRDRAVQAGVSDFLAKPFASRQLADVVERSLGAHGTRH
ncbi:MAG: response regulator [Vicinamibacterales bacterium]